MELETIKEVFLEASSRKLTFVELRLDEKNLVCWLQGIIPPVPEAKAKCVAIVEHIRELRTHFVHLGT